MNISTAARKRADIKYKYRNDPDKLKAYMEKHPELYQNIKPRGRPKIKYGNCDLCGEPKNKDNQHKKCEDILPHAKKIITHLLKNIDSVDEDIINNIVEFIDSNF